MEGFHMTGCCTVLAIGLLRLLLSRRIPSRVFALLWIGALGVILLPAGLTSPLSVYGLLPRIGTDAAEAASGSAEFLPKALGLWPILRQGVTAAALLGLIGSWVLALLRLHRCRPADSPAAADWQAAHPLLRPLRICVGRVPAPVCGGFLLPRIVLPADMDLSDRARLDCVLTHEYIHICRFDPLIKLLAAVVLCLRWYDPFVWAAVLAMGRDMEYACDEAVLDSGIPARQYAASLLRAALRRAELLPAAARFNAGQIERRVERIAAHRPRSCLCWLAAAVLALSLLVCFGTSPRAAEQTIPKTEQASLMASARLPACKPDLWTWDPAFPTPNRADAEP